MSSEGDSTESPTKTSAQEQVSLCNGEAQVTPKLVELDEQRTPVKEVSVNGAAGKHASFANRKRSANAISQRIPVQEVVRELTDPHHGKYPTGISPKQLLAHILTMPEQHRPAVRKNWLQVAFLIL
uniref:Uncharacterized protein n=1 Tax=Plectus sambesii TaxID=2011161 RepID=A0A914UVV0_9BILA